MKRTILLTLIITFLSLQGHSQSEPKLFYFGAGIGFGFFNPADVNTIIENNYSGAQEEFGFYNIIMYYVLNAKGSFFFSKYTELQLEVEGAFAPKFISVANTGETDFYSFNRFTPALKFNLHIPAGKRLSVYFGPGINWSTLKFNNADGNDLKGNCLGFSGQAGVMLRFSKWAIEPFITVNFIKDKNEDLIGMGYIYTNPDLSYTGVQIGNTFFF